MVHPTSSPWSSRKTRLDIEDHMDHSDERVRDEGRRIVTVRYPETITDDTDIVECIRFESPEDLPNKIYYPLMFCV